MPRPRFHRVVAAAAIALPVLLVAPPAVASPGDLDTSFSGDGIARAAVNDRAFAAGAGIDATGKVFVDGTEDR